MNLGFFSACTTLCIATTYRRRIQGAVCFLLCSLVPSSHVFAQEKPDDILLISVGESSDRYSDVAVHLQGLLSGASGFDEAQVDIFENSTIESLADGFYDQNSADISLRAKVAEGYGTVILIPTIIDTPNGTIEYTEFGGGPTNVYDDAPFDNEYFCPEVFYEGCSQFSKLILNSGSKPMIFLPDNPDEELATYGPIMYRVASGVDMELVPGAYALDAAGATTAAKEAYLYACSIFTELTGLNASASSYSPSGISGADATTLGNTAETTVNLHHTTVHYTTSYENEGAVVYRNLDITTAPFNNVVRYRYKGSSTQDWTRDALTKIINSDNATADAAYRKLGIKSNGFSGGTRFWHADDFDEWANAAETVTQGDKIAYEPDQAAFMYVSGSWTGADAQDVIDRDQSNMIPMAFDWIKSFALSPAVSGTASTTDALDYHSCNELYFNYAERGWKLIPLTIGMGRLNEAVPGFVASDDALHSSDPLVYMNAYMMLSSALGTQFPLPEITADDIHRGSYTTEQIHEACLIGHDLIKELAFLSETGSYVPESDLAIVTDALPDVPSDAPYSHQLSASGGDSAYTWEIVSDAKLPEGLSLSTDGLISGTVTNGAGTSTLLFRATDGTGAFSKAALKLTTALPVGDITETTDVVAANDTDYGTNAVATMYSAVLTAPDGLATFRIAIDVDPMAEGSVTCDSGGLWGIKSGTSPVGWWNTFDGSLAESVDSVSNIQIVDFDANGGTLGIGDFTVLSFKSIIVRNGNNNPDRVKVVAGGIANATGGLKMSSDPETIDLQALAGSSAVSSFTLANGNVGNSSDRWNIESVQVEYTINIPSDDAYTEWASAYSLVGDAAMAEADSENGGSGDGYNNLLEYALGMNPNVSDAGSRDFISTEQESNSTYFVYSYERRTDYLALGLSYMPIVTTDLFTPSTASPHNVSVGTPVDGFETVKTRYLINNDSKFIRLLVEMN
ncbi:MAG: Ig domain-containing protein [Luteolibacter sp.]